MTAPRKPQKWLLLVHQIPPKPSYFRAKVGRRLARIGAVPIKNSVYVLPHTDQAQEDFQWATREIIAEGGDATLCAASLVEGMRDEQVEALFQAARQADYAQLAEEARAILADTPSRPSNDERPQIEAHLTRLTKRMAEIAAVDFFAAPGREATESSIAAIAKRARGRAVKHEGPTLGVKRADYQKRTWVTRKNIHVDRIASAWLIKTFIDDKPTFKFVEPKGHQPRANEVSFDMFDATFTHIGDRCTFEVLVEQFGLRESGLRVIAEIVHDIDVKDGKFNRPEAPGIASLIAGIAVSQRDDRERIAAGSIMFDALLELHRRKQRP